MTDFSDNGKAKGGGDGAAAPSGEGRRDRLTVEKLAQAKRIPAADLLAWGVEDCPKGVRIRYFQADGFPARSQIRTSLHGLSRFHWDDDAGGIVPYGLWELHRARRAGYLHVVEGASDVWALWAHGEPALGSPGAGMAGKFLPENFDGIETVWVWYEVGEGGELLWEQLTERLAGFPHPPMCWGCWDLGPCKDVSDVHVRDAAGFTAAVSLACKTAFSLGAPRPPSAIKAGEADPAADAEAEERLTQAQQLQEIGSACELIYTPMREAFAAVPAGTGPDAGREVLPVAAGGLGEWLSYQYWARTGRAPGRGALAEALDCLTARAKYQGSKEQIHVRLAGAADGLVVLDLGTDDGAAAVVGPGGWEVTCKPPVRLWRPGGLLPLPRPVSGGRLDSLWQCVNIAPADRVLVACWLLMTLHPRGPFPLLCLNGEQGSAKSSGCLYLRSVVDPNAAPLRKPPEGEEDLLIAARHSRVICIDNISHMPQRASDSLCRVATGAGMGTRQKYSDLGEVLLNVCRPILLNGIPEFIDQDDLADRSVIVRCPRLSRAGWRLDTEVEECFRREHPVILGCLLDAMGDVLRQAGHKPPGNLARMAEFDLLARRGEAALGFAAGSYRAASAANRAAAVAGVVDAEPVARSLLRFWGDLAGSEWEGTPTELLDTLRGRDPALTTEKKWPGDPAVLSRKLSRLAPALRAHGLDVELGTARGERGKERRVRLTANTQVAPDAPRRAPE